MLLRGQLSGFSQTVLFPFRVHHVLERFGEVGLARAAVYDAQPLKLGWDIYIFIDFYTGKISLLITLKRKKKPVAI